LFTGDDFREALGRGLGVDLEVPGETLHVALVDDDALVTAAIRRAFAAIVEGRHHGIVTVRRIIAAWITPSLLCRPIFSSTVTLPPPSTRSSLPPAAGSG